MAPTSSASSSPLEIADGSSTMYNDSESTASAWWCGTASTESELLSAAVLCAAIGATTDHALTPTTSSNDTNDDNDDLVRARRALEAHIRQSPLPHDLLFPVLEFHRDFVLMETTQSVLCAVRATKTRDILDTVLGSTIPLAQPYEFRFGGARVHVPFWKRAQKLDLYAAARRAKRSKKMLLLCGHSIGGSIAQLGFCELVYQHLPTKARLALEKMDYEQKKRMAAPVAERAAAPTLAQLRATMAAVFDTASLDHAALVQSLPNIMAVGFGAPYSASYELAAFLEPLGMAKRSITFVNELDCIPSILNVAQSAAMLAKTTERVVTITKATKTLLNLLPSKMQTVLAGLATASTASDSSSATVPTATSAYIAMSLNILQNSFQKLRDYNIVKDTSALEYAPWGTYILLAKRTADFHVLYDAVAILDALHAASDATTTLTGNSILQHLMSAYVDAVAKRCTTIQINATMNYYERLNVARTATQREIRSAYRALALKWHPDKWSARRTATGANARVTLEEREMAENVFKLLAESYEVLADPVARKAYDAHLARAPSLTEEFVRDGTVNGMTLDEAITVFREMFDRGSGVVSRATSRFSSSSSSVVGQPTLRRAPPAGDSAQSLVANNHDNIFLQDRVRVIRKTAATSGGTTAEAQEKVMYVQPEELLAGDVAAPSSSKAPNAGLKTISVVGGAVAVGASVALIVSAWSQYSESSKRKRQAETVRNMSGNHLLLLMEDHVSSVRASNAHKKLKPSAAPLPAVPEVPQEPTVTVTICSADELEPLPPLEDTPVDASSAMALVTASSSSADAVAAASASAVAAHEDGHDDTERQELELMDEFYDCAAEFDAAALEAFAEDEFYDCVDLAEDIAEFFDTVDDDDDSLDSQPIALSDDIDMDNAAAATPVSNHERLVLQAGGVLFPTGSTVSTPFGLGTVEDWRDGCSSAAIRFNAHTVGFIQKRDVERGASHALAQASAQLETKRLALAERVVANYELDGASNTARANFQAIVRASKDGALDSGLRAAGGVALAKGMARTSTRLGGAVAAPLTIASILVDIGKEYYSYRTKHTERKSQGVLSATSERLLMKDFRLKAGQHIAGGTAAAAGASIGAYSVASAVGFWTGVGIAGPLGVVAATSAAVVGGMLGFFAGTKAYNGYTASYFQSHRHAKEHIDRLELGARIMFNEYDADGTGVISKRDCIQIMTKLYEASSAVSERGYQQTVDVLESDAFEGPVTWSMFWEWVSTEAARSLHALELEEAQRAPDAATESWWTSYMTYFSYSASPQALPAPPARAAPESCMYPSVVTALQLQLRASEDDADAQEANLVVLRAQLEALVDSGALTVGDAYQLSDALESVDADVQASARRTIEALQSGLGESDAAASGVVISEGFSGTDHVLDDDDVEEKALVPVRAPTPAAAQTPNGATAATTGPARTRHDEHEEIDVLCSLLSTHGLREYLHAHNIEPSAETRRHEDLHCLALQTTVPTSSTALSTAHRAH